MVVHRYETYILKTWSGVKTDTISDVTKQYEKKLAAEKRIRAEQEMKLASSEQLIENVTKQYEEKLAHERILREEQEARLLSSEKLRKEKQVIEQRTALEIRRAREEHDDSLINPFRGTSCSQLKGVIGENYVMEILTEIGIDYVDKHNTHHSGDLWVLSKNKKILWLIEIKNKKVITSEDITKFEFDINNVAKHHRDLTVRGLFISLNSDTILDKTGKNKISFSLETTYLTRDFATKEILSMYFQIMNNFTTEPTPEASSDELKESLTILRSQYKSFEENIGICKKHRQYASTLKDDMKTLIIDLESKLIFAESILMNYDGELKEQKTKETKLIEYLNGCKNFTIKECRYILSGHLPKGINRLTKPEIISWKLSKE